jgi:cobalt transporter subunit CbtB
MIMSTSTASALRATRADGRSSTLVAATCAALIGLGLVWGVGFAGANLLHNAAHDARHAAGFPCH